MSIRKAFTWPEVLVVILVVFGAMFYFLMPSLSNDRRTAHQMMNSANLRGLASGMNEFAKSNNDFLPGFDSKGMILTASPSNTGSKTNSGAAFGSRLWFLLNEQYIGGDLLINPKDTLTRWTSGRPCTTTNFSYAGLQIGDDAAATTTEHHAGRAGEWRNNANAKAILLSDRLCIASDTADAAGTSVWTFTKGDWKGNVVWGDNHTEFAPTHTGFTTQYSPYSAATTRSAGITNANDNLFVTQAAPGTTETSAASDANAMLIYY